jgi:DNA-binding transcriptional LysR family regulator
MDTTGLRTFITAAEQESFSHAADQLYITQPAVSKRVATLEDELGTPLFDRIGRRVFLTEAGRELLPRAKSILNDIEDSRRLISNLSGTVTGRLSIGTSHHIGLHRLPPILRNYSAQYPDVELDLHFMDSEAACRAVLAGELELGIVTLPPDPIDDLETEIIWPDPLSIVVNKNHPLAKQKTSKPQNLIDTQAILPAHGTYTRELLEQAFELRGLTLTTGMTTNYLETIKMMVSVGLGWSVLPNSMLSKEIVVLDVKGINISRQLGFVHHPRHTLSNAAKAIIETLRGQISNKQ